MTATENINPKSPFIMNVKSENDALCPSGENIHAMPEKEHMPINTEDTFMV